MYTCPICPAPLIEKTVFSPFVVVPTGQSHLDLCDPMNFSMLGFPVHHCLPESQLKLMIMESVMLSKHFVLCCPLLFLPSIFPSIRVFSIESVLQSGSQSIGASASTSVLSMNTQARLVSFPCSTSDSHESSPVFLPGESHGQRSLVGYTP